MCDQRKGKLWVSVSQHSAKSHQLMTVLFVEILPEKECSYDAMKHFIMPRQIHNSI